jgi:hypothetical protein
MITIIRMGMIVLAAKPKVEGMGYDNPNHSRN